MPVQTATALKRSWIPVRFVEQGIKSGNVETDMIIGTFEDLIRNKQRLAPNTIEPKLYTIIGAVEKAPAKVGFSYFSSIYSACMRYVHIYERDRHKGWIRSKMYKKLQDAAEKRMIETANGPKDPEQLSLLPAA